MDSFTDTNAKIKKSLDLKKLLPIGIIILLVLGVIFVLFRQFFLNNQDNSNTDDSLDNEVLYLEINDNAIAKFGDNEINLPSGWTITSYLSEEEYNSLICNNLVSSVSSKSCLIYEISDGTNYFYLTNPVNIINIDNPKGEIKLEEVEFLGEIVNLNIEELDLYTENDNGELVLNEESKFVKQAYLCSNNICLSSGKLSLDIESSNNSLNEFRELIKKF